RRRQNGNIFNSDIQSNGTPLQNRRRRRSSDNLPNIKDVVNLDENGIILDADKFPTSNLFGSKNRKKRGALQDLVNSMPSLSKLTQNGNLLDPDTLPNLNGLPSLDTLLPNLGGNRRRR
ncbi:uncharacterized protein LOC142597587, partial [Dermatophagoides farinae]|uniref:uncharacterized protein LOC142597587 n=1 Tax=Dermatophagoides farinae TaxID=6954 RepID=UPI003F615C91